MDELLEISKGLTKMFPSKENDPFQIATRLAEECGELAKEVSHWERTGVKVQKHGEPSKESLVGEVKNVITCALQIAIYYGAEKELDESIKESYKSLKAKGFI